MRSGTIDLELSPYRELCSVLFLHKIADLRVRSFLLLHELIARKRPNIKPFFLILIMKSNQLFILIICQSTRRGNIHNHNSLQIVISKVLSKINLLSCCRLSTNTEQILSTTLDLFKLLLFDHIKQRRSH